MKQALKLGLILALYGTVSCLALAVVNNFTSPLIALHAKEKENAGLKMIFPNANDFIQITDFEKLPSSTNIESFYKAINNNTLLGYAIKCTGPTYDTTTLLAGFDTNLIITGVHILSTSDSPGFGQKAADSSYNTSKGKTFYGQFEGVNAKDSLVVGTDFEAITGATITSRSIGTMVTNAAKVVSSYITKTGGAK